MTHRIKFCFMLTDVVPVSKLLHLSISVSCHHSNCIISGIDYCQGDPNLNAEYDLQQASPDSLMFIEKIRQQLSNYFTQADFQFSLPFELHLGTPFQQRVWQALTEIPSSEVKTYGELAKELNSSARAVGNACRRNLFPVIVPCHRVVSASGIGGYAGDTLETQKGSINFLKIKQWLLAHERISLQ